MGGYGKGVGTGGGGQGGGLRLVRLAGGVRVFVAHHVLTLRPRSSLETGPALSVAQWTGQVL